MAIKKVLVVIDKSNIDQLTFRKGQDVIQPTLSDDGEYFFDIEFLENPKWKNEVDDLLDVCEYKEVKLREDHFLPPQSDKPIGQAKGNFNSLLAKHKGDIDLALNEYYGL